MPRSLAGCASAGAARRASARFAPETFFADLKPGDYVVHVEYGIGRYHGIVQKQLGALQREYLEIEYAAGDRLFVPIHQADRVSRYLGADEREPYLHRLGGSEWATVRERASRAVRDIAGSCWSSMPRARSPPAMPSRRIWPGSTSWRPPSPTRRPRTSSRPSRR